MKTPLAAVAVLALALPLAAAPRSYTISADGKNNAAFVLNDALETVDGISKKISGTIVADPENVAASSVELAVELSAIDTDSDLRDSHIRDEFVQTAKFPRATFKSVAVSAPAAPLLPNQPFEVSITGDFTMHGTTRRITVPVRIVLIPESDITRSSRGPGDWLHATAKWPLKLSDYGIRIPTSFADDRIEAKLDVFAGARR
jgi:polyisoprenoid-binding protein YceI